MQVIDLEFRPGGLVAFFDDGSEVVGTFKVRDGVLFLDGFSSVQRQALSFFKENQIDDIARLDPRLAALQPMLPSPIPIFMFVVLPDTQKYSVNSNTVFNEQTAWIANNISRENIKFVSHTGDIVQNGGGISEWNFADAAMITLDGIVPYATCIGNHDYTVVSDRTAGNESNFISYFGPTRYSAYSWYKGSSPTGMSSYQLFTANGRTYMHMTWELELDGEDRTWVEETLEDNCQYPTIISTHSAMTDNDEFLAPQYGGTPSEELFDEVVQRNPQIFLVLCSHFVFDDGEGFLARETDSEDTVWYLQTNYQFQPNDGNGWLRLLEFDEENDRITVSSYSPSLDESNLYTGSEFSININFAERFDKTYIKTLAYDTFTRADSSDIGSSESIGPNGEALTPIPYEIFNDIGDSSAGTGEFTITGNKLAFDSPTDINQMACMLDVGYSDVVFTIDMTQGFNSLTGVVFRFQDANNYYVALFEDGYSEIYVSRFINGTQTFDIFSFGDFFGSNTDGVAFTFVFELIGDNLNIKDGNGDIIIADTEFTNIGDFSTFNSATKFGLLGTNSNFVTGAHVFYDNLKIERSTGFCPRVDPTAAVSEPPIEPDPELDLGELWWAGDIEGASPAVENAELDDISGTRQIVYENSIAGLLFDDLAIDTTNSKIYWTEPEADAIFRANLNGTGQVVFRTVANLKPTGLAIDVVNNYLFYSCVGSLSITDGQIRRISLDGSGDMAVVTGLASPRSVTLDIPGQQIFWFDDFELVPGSSPAISRSNYNGSNKTEIVGFPRSNVGNTRTIEAVFASSLQVYKGSLYFTARRRIGITSILLMSVGFDGLHDRAANFYGFNDIVGTVEPQRFIISNDKVYVSGIEKRSSQEFRYVIRVGDLGSYNNIESNTNIITFDEFASGVDPTETVRGIALVPGIEAVEDPLTDDRLILASKTFVTGLSILNSLEKDLSHYDLISEHGGNLLGIDVDNRERTLTNGDPTKHVYVVEGDEDVQPPANIIRRCNLGETGFVDVFVSNVSNLVDVSVDEDSNRLFFINGGTGTMLNGLVRTSNINGTGVGTITNNGVGYLWSCDWSNRSKQLFVGDRGITGGPAKVHRFVEDIVPWVRDVIWSDSEQQQYVSVSVDDTNGHLYLAVQPLSGFGYISRMNFDGSGLVKLQTSIKPIRIAVDTGAERVWYIDTETDTLRFLRFSGGSEIVQPIEQPSPLINFNSVAVVAAFTPGE